MRRDIADLRREVDDLESGGREYPLAGLIRFMSSDSFEVIDPEQRIALVDGQRCRVAEYIDISSNERGERVSEELTEEEYREAVR